jgi:hypothetical protein
LLERIGDPAASGLRWLARLGSVPPAAAALRLLIAAKRRAPGESVHREIQADCKAWLQRLEASVHT